MLHPLFSGGAGGSLLHSRSVWFHTGDLGICLFLIQDVLNVEVKHHKRVKRGHRDSSGTTGLVLSPPSSPQPLSRWHLSCTKPLAVAEQGEVGHALSQESTLQKQQVQPKSGNQVLGD